MSDRRNTCPFVDLTLRHALRLLGLSSLWELLGQDFVEADNPRTREVLDKWVSVGVAFLTPGERRAFVAHLCRYANGRLKWAGKLLHTDPVLIRIKAAVDDVPI